MHPECQLTWRRPSARIYALAKWWWQCWLAMPGHHQCHKYRVLLQTLCTVMQDHGCVGISFMALVTSKMWGWILHGKQQGISSYTVHNDAVTHLAPFPCHAAQLNHLTPIPGCVTCCPTTPRSLEVVFIVNWVWRCWWWSEKRNIEISSDPTITKGTSNSNAALPNVPSNLPHRYGFGWGTDSCTCTCTPTYLWLVPMQVSLPVSITTWTSIKKLNCHLSGNDDSCTMCAV